MHILLVIINIITFYLFIIVKGGLFQLQEC